jgi:tetratricopeptide (TPR) repeat protein
MGLRHHVYRAINNVGEKMKSGMMQDAESAMHRVESLGLLLFLIQVGCAASIELHRGRIALLGGMPETAATHFGQAAAESERLAYSQLRQGVWTYLGRAYYDSRKYPEARQALERAVAVNSDDGFARLYLGLTLARQGSYEAGRKEVLDGLQILSDRLNTIVYSTASGFYWDPTGQLRGELQAARRAVTDAKPNLDGLFARLENLGIALEQEIDSAAKDETIQMNRKLGGDQ